MNTADREDFLKTTSRGLWLSGIVRTRWTVLAALGMVTVGAFIKLTSELREGELDAFDQKALAYVVQLRTPVINAAAVDLTALGSATVLSLVVVAAGLFLALGKHWRNLTHLLIASLGAAAWSSVLKAALERERPSSMVPSLVNVAGFSYPSGHSLTSAGVYLTLAILACRRLRSPGQRAAIVALTMAVVFAIGTSRAYIGVHYPSDVVAGLLLGTGWALLVSAAGSFGRASARPATGSSGSSG